MQKNFCTLINKTCANRSAARPPNKIKCAAVSAKKSSSPSTVNFSTAVPDPSAGKKAEIVKQYDAWFYELDKLIPIYSPPYSTLMNLALRVYSEALETMEMLSARAQKRTLLIEEVRIFVESQELIGQSIDTFKALQERAAIDSQNQKYQQQQQELDDQILKIQIDQQNKIDQQNHEQYCKQLRRELAARGSLDSGVGQQYLRDRGC
jgi:hypothetical protein